MAHKSLKTINKNWDNLAVAAGNLSQRAHRYAVDTLRHYTETGDLSGFIHAVTVLKGRGLNRRALILWIEKHARARLNVIDRKTGEITFTKKPKADHTTIDVDKADKSPFYADDEANGKAGDDNKSFSLLGRVKSAIKKAGEIQVDNAGYDMSKVTIDGDLVSELEMVINRYEPANAADKPVGLIKVA